MGRIKNKVLYPLQVPIKPSDYWIGSDGVTGITKNFSAQAVIDLTLSYIGFDNSITGLVSVGSITQENGVITLTDVVWRIYSDEFSVPIQSFEITPATEGYYRTDIITGNPDGELELQEGEESENNPVQPIPGAMKVLVAVINVFGDEINPGLPAVTDIMLKSDESQYLFYNQGLVENLVWNNHNTYRWKNKKDVTMTLTNMTINPAMAEFLYDGRLFTLVNDGGGNITLKHLYPEASIPFFFQNGRDLILKTNYIVVFKYSSVSGYLEFVSLSIPDATGLPYYNSSYPDLDSVQAALDSLLYVYPDITSFTNNVNNVEKGTIVTSVLLTWILNKPMATQSLNNGIGSISSSVLLYNHTGQNITTNRTYTLTVGDGVNSDSASTTISFLNKRYWGTSPNITLNSAGILGLANSELATSRLQTRTINGGGNYIYFCFPTSFGTPSFVVNGLPNTAFTITTVSFTNASGFTENYYVCRTDTVQFGTLTIQIL